MLIKNADEVKDHLNKYPNASVKTAITIKLGFVSCISPVPNLFGAELICHPQTRNDLMILIKDTQ